jgi:endonuclease-8
MEGPSLVICKEETAFLKGKKILRASGSSTIEFKRLENKRVKSIRSFGKHLLIQFNSFAIRIHFLMFGSYRINERRERIPRLSLEFEKDELNFYSCAIRIIEDDLNAVYDWASDVMSNQWDPAKARRKLKKFPAMNVGDALLDQTIFAGVGNIIKNEVLYRLCIHPNSRIGGLPPRKLTALINEARNYSFDFYEWKKLFVLRKHWQIYKKKKCKRCGAPVILEHTGDNPRRSFYCENCQILYK